MKRFPQKDIRLEEKELNTDLGQDNTIFVGSSCDMFAEDIPKEWIVKVFEHCEDYLDNSFLFQSKNPKRFIDLCPDYLNVKYSKRVIIGTTIETNRDGDFSWEYHISNAPKPIDRFKWFDSAQAYHKMLSIEPILDFDLTILLSWIQTIKPDFVSIGADSKGHNLPEPSKEKTLELLAEIKIFSELKIKGNLRRILK